VVFSIEDGCLNQQTTNPKMLIFGNGLPSTVEQVYGHVSAAVK
jgi:hypothetical protein